MPRGRLGAPVFEHHKELTVGAVRLTRMGQR